MMQRLCAKLRCLAVHSSQPRRLLHFSTPHVHVPPAWTISRSSSSSSSSFMPFLPSSATHASISRQASCSSLLPLSLIQLRHYSAQEKKRKRMTPVVSKIKKTKMKFYSSYKSRFRPLKDGTIRRWREGKRHNAHLKSKISKRRLRLPAIVPAAYAKVMKKLNFCN